MKVQSGSQPTQEGTIRGRYSLSFSESLTLEHWRRYSAGGAFQQRVQEKLLTEERRSEKENAHLGPRQWVRHPIQLMIERLIAVAILLTDYVPGVLFTSPLIFGMILPGRNSYSSFADEKTVSQRLNTWLKPPCWRQSEPRNKK